MEVASSEGTAARAGAEGGSLKRPAGGVGAAHQLTDLSRGNLTLKKPKVEKRGQFDTGKVVGRIFLMKVAILRRVILGEECGSSLENMLYVEKYWIQYYVKVALAVGSATGIE